MSDRIKEASFFGRRIGDMDREELFEVIEHLSRKVDEASNPYEIRANVLGKIEMIRRGEATHAKPEARQ